MFSKFNILEVLKCPNSCSGLLSQENVREHCGEFQGYLSCLTCGSRIHFYHGVLELSEKVQEFNEVDSYNKKVFFETWKLAPALYNEVPWDSEYEIYKSLSGQFDNKIVLDAGCGSGRVIEYISQFNPRGIIMVDIGDSINIAKNRFLQQNFNFPILYIKSNLNNLPIRDTSIETVICNGVLHHVANQEQVLKQLFRICSTNIILGIVSEKLFFGRIWISGNKLRKIIRIYYNPKLCFIVAKYLSFFAILFFISLKFSPKRSIRKIGNNFLSDPFRAKKLHYLILDFITAPYYLKYSDNFYLNIASENFFQLRRQLYSNQETFFNFNRKT